MSNQDRQRNRRSKVIKSNLSSNNDPFTLNATYFTPATPESQASHTPADHYFGGYGRRTTHSSN